MPVEFGTSTLEPDPAGPLRCPHLSATRGRGLPHGDGGAVPDHDERNRAPDRPRHVSRRGPGPRRAAATAACRGCAGADGAASTPGVIASSSTAGTTAAATTLATRSGPAALPGHPPRSCR